MLLVEGIRSRLQRMHDQKLDKLYDHVRREQKSMFDEVN